MTAWARRWWLRNGSDVAVFVLLVEMTGVLLIVPLVGLAVLVRAVFRGPAYVADAINYRLGITPDLRIAGDLQKVADEVTRFSGIVKQIARFIARGCGNG